MLELYILFKAWEMPWWNNAVDNPASACPNTVKFIKDNFSGADQEFRMEQIERGLKYGRHELI